MFWRRLGFLVLISALPACLVETAAEHDDTGSEDVASAQQALGVAANLYVGVDDTFTVYLNGKSVGSGNSWNTTFQYAVQLTAGDNVVAIKATNVGGGYGAIAALKTGVKHWETTTSTKVSTSAPAGWETLDFDDRTWANATDLGDATSRPLTGFPSSSPAHWVWSSSSSTTTVYIRLHARLTSLVGFAAGTTTGGAGGTISTVTNATDFINQVGDATTRIIQIPEGVTLSFSKPRSQTVCQRSCYYNNAQVTNNVTGDALCFTGNKKWEPNRTYVAGFIMYPTVNNNHYYKALTGGTTGANEPTWPTGSGSTVTDGAVKWQESGAEARTTVTRDETKIHINSNKTIVGLGAGAALKGASLDLGGESNIIIQNLTITNVNPSLIEAGDGISLSNTQNVWLDHNELGSISDGFVDMVNSSNITLSWNRFNGANAAYCGGKHNYISLVQESEVTFHHNHFLNTGMRNPKLYGASTHGHIFNNLYENVSGQSVTAISGGQGLVEGNYFDDSANPHWRFPATVLGLLSAPAGSNVYVGLSANANQAKDTGDTVFAPGYTYNVDDANLVQSLVTDAAGPHVLN